MMDQFSAEVRTQRGQNTRKTPKLQPFSAFSALVRLMLSQWTDENGGARDVTRWLPASLPTRQASRDFGNGFGNAEATAEKDQFLQAFSARIRRMLSPYNPTFQDRRRRFGEVPALGVGRAA